MKDFIKSDVEVADGSQTNADIVRSLIDAWNRRDPGVHAYHADAEWDFTRSRFGEIRHRWKGVDGMREVFGKVFEAWAELRVEPERIVEVGDEVLVLAHHFGRRPTSGIEVSDTGAYVIGMRDGKVTKFTFYSDRAEALTAVGLPPDEQGT